ncbi:MAG TPA: efflux RND transporter periplasmic adaptor subunit, partial [Candidatus Acidoferrum sp.]|nr:efflux RND transporter periplasmic adaptor subunit [Candidatus Acidoferrum sp.]
MHRRFQSMCIATACACVLIASGCQKPQAAAGPPAAVPVRVAKAELRTIPVQLTAIGNVEAFATVSVKPLVAGELQSIHFAEGQDVHKGDLLFVIDRKPYQAALDQAEANLARDKATAVNARVEATRYANLFAQGVTSREQTDQATSTADAAEALVRSDQAAVDYAKLNLEYCTINSPIDGRTGSYQVKPGNLVKANDVPVLIVINQITPIYLDFSVPEQFLADIKKYMAQSTLHVQATIPTDPGKAEIGTVTFVDNTVDITTGTIKLKATFANEQRRLWPGQYVNTVLTLTAISNSTVVPSQALQTGQNGQFIFVIH